MCEIADSQSLNDWNSKCEHWMCQAYVRCLLGVKLYPVQTSRTARGYNRCMIVCITTYFAVFYFEMFSNRLILISGKTLVSSGNTDTKTNSSNGITRSVHAGGNIDPLIVFLVINIESLRRFCEFIVEFRNDRSWWYCYCLHQAERPRIPNRYSGIWRVLESSSYWWSPPDGRICLNCSFRSDDGDFQPWFIRYPGGSLRRTECSTDIVHLFLVDMFVHADINTRICFSPILFYCFSYSIWYFIFHRNCTKVLT